MTYVHEALAGQLLERSVKLYNLISKQIMQIVSVQKKVGKIFVKPVL